MLSIFKSVYLHTLGLRAKWRSSLYIVSTRSSSPGILSPSRRIKHIYIHNKHWRSGTPPSAAAADDGDTIPDGIYVRDPPCIYHTDSRRCYAPTKLTRESRTFWLRLRVMLYEYISSMLYFTRIYIYEDDIHQSDRAFGAALVYAV